MLNIANSSLLVYKAHKCTKLGTFHTINYFSGGVPDQYVRIKSKDYLMYHGVTDSLEKVNPLTNYSLLSINGKVTISPNN